MLVLSRDLNEKVQIRDKDSGEIIIVTLLEIRSRNRVRLGFSASPRFEIMRTELIEVSKDEDKR